MLRTVPSIDAAFEDAGLPGQLQPALDELAQALREVDEEVRIKEETLHERDRALDNLAGFPDFADRIRLTLPVRRRRGASAPGDRIAVRRC